jgi:hypothetical protein
VTRGRQRGREPDRGVDVVGLDEVVAGQNVGGVGERSVVQDRRVVLDADGCRRPDRLEARAADDLALFVDVPVAGEQRVALFVAEAPGFS